MELEAFEAQEEDRREQRSRLNTLVAITVALLVTFMGLARVKNGNIVQAMLEAQSNKVDYYNWYQARNIREDVARAAASQMAAHAQSQPQARAAFEPVISEFRKLAGEQASKKRRVGMLAAEFEKKYNQLAGRKDQLDLAEAALAIAVAVLAITSLTQKRWLYIIAMVPALFGIMMGLAGFANWPIHPETLIRFLGA